MKHITINLAGLIAFMAITACSHDDSGRYERLMTAGKASFASGRYDDAIQAWTAAGRIEPGNPERLVLLAKANQRSARFGLSTKLLQQAVKKNYKPVEAYFMIAENDILVGNFEAARNVSRKLGKRIPRDYRLILLKGDIAAFMGRYHEGELLYRQAIALNARRADAYFKLAAILLVQGRGSAADSYYHKAVRLDSHPSIQFWLHCAEYLTLKGDAKNAERAMRQALKMQPGNFYIKIKIAQLLLAFKKYDALLAFFSNPDDASLRNPEVQKIVVEALLNTSQLKRAYAILKKHTESDDSEWLLLFGKYNLLNGAFAYATSYFEKALESRKNDPNAYYMLALAYVAANKVNLASQTLIQALTRFPGMIEAELALADLYFEKGEYDLSIDYLKRLIREAPENFRAYLSLGDCMLATGRYDEAKLDFQKALTLDKGSMVARYYLALSDEKTGQYEEAVRLYRSILNEKPDSKDAGLRLANLLKREHRVHEALDLFTALLEKRPKDGYLKVIIGDIYKMTNAPEKAAQYFKSALKDDPLLIESYKGLADLQTDVAGKISVIKSALKKVPHSIELQIILANLYFKSDQLEPAIALMKHIYVLRPQSPAVANNLSWLYLQTNTNLTKAFELARAAFEAEPDNPYYAHTLGVAFHKMGLYKNALWYFQESLRLLDEKPEKYVEDNKFRAIVSYSLALTLIDTGKINEAREKLQVALDTGLPARYETNAHEILSSIINSN